MIESTPTIGIISQYHALDISFLTSNQNILDWNLVSINRNIIWTKEIITSFEHLLNWDTLISNSAINWKEPDLFLMASEHGKIWGLFEKKETVWTKKDYYNLKNEKSLRENWVIIQRVFLTQDLDWALR